MRLRLRALARLAAKRNAVRASQAPNPSRARKLAKIEGSRFGSSLLSSRSNWARSASTLSRPVGVLSA
jgi:hypothetical protein